MRVSSVLTFILERHKIYMRRSAGEQKPWTSDRILLSYRFCNVYRELDAVTLWISKNWREPLDAKHSVNGWFWMAVARFVNDTGTLEELTPMVLRDVWDEKFFIETLKARRDRGLRVFNPAYIVSTNGRKMDKVDYVGKHVLSGLWTQCERLTPRVSDTLLSFHTRLTSADGVGSFMGAQIVADIKYMRSCPLIQAPDWWSFAAPGPGSMRGLNRVYERTTKESWPGTSWLHHMIQLKNALDPLIEQAGLQKLHMQDLQNCMCEFDKYERVRLGEGTPKQLYPGLGV